ncbi:MAG: hypothetical protein IH881_19270 [Myxococcales bacterium]|nr:hypothetical protein [Myxococcales bacterium]
MDDWGIIYSGSAESAESLAEQIADAKLLVHKRVERGPIVDRSGGRTYVTHVSVPPECEAKAVVILDSWRRRGATRAAVTLRRLFTVLLLSFIPPSLWLGTGWLGIAGTAFPKLNLVFGLWMISLVVVAQIEHRRYTRERIYLAAQ